METIMMTQGHRKPYLQLMIGSLTMGRFSYIYTHRVAVGHRGLSSPCAMRLHLLSVMRRCSAQDQQDNYRMTWNRYDKERLLPVQIGSIEFKG